MLFRSSDSDRRVQITQSNLPTIYRPPSITLALVVPSINPLSAAAHLKIRLGIHPHPTRLLRPPSLFSAAVQPATSSLLPEWTRPPPLDPCAGAPRLQAAGKSWPPAALMAPVIQLAPPVRLRARPWPPASGAVHLSSRARAKPTPPSFQRSEEHTSELQSQR